MIPADTDMLGGHHQGDVEFESGAIVLFFKMASKMAADI